MRHKQFSSAQRHRRSFFKAFAGAAASTATAAALGYVIALSALAGWVLAGLAAAVAVSLWLDSRLHRHAAPAPPAPFYFLPQQRGTD